MPTAQQIAEERTLIQSLRQRHATFDAKFNPLVKGTGAGPSSADLRAFLAFAGSLDRELASLASAGTRLAGAGLATFESELARFRGELAKIQEIFQGMITGRHDADVKDRAIATQSAAAEASMRQQIYENRRKAFGDADAVFSKYLNSK